MGTRADFYIGKGKNAKWVGSVAYNGYPSVIKPSHREKKYDKDLGKVFDTQKLDEWVGSHLFESKTEKEFLDRLDLLFKNRNDFTTPDMGWPWPWPNSSVTDYTYHFVDGKVYVSEYGRGWIDTSKYIDDLKKLDSLDFNQEEIQEYPDMSSVENFVKPGDPRSGCFVVNIG